MSLIITYIGSKGCVMIADKRRIGFLGDEKSREELEEELYSGAIKTDEELRKKASSRGITLNITDSADKIWENGDVVVGEVRSKTPFETKRKRIYGTTGAYNLVEFWGSEIKQVKTGESSILVVGNRMAKEIANKYIQKHWKTKTNLKNIGELLKEVMEEAASKTPSVSKKYDLIIKHAPMNVKDAKELLRTTVIEDSKELKKWRKNLKKEMKEKTKEINTLSKIVTQGSIGKVKDIQGNKVKITLKEGIEALNVRFKPIAKPGEQVKMEVKDPSAVKIGDEAVIENEKLIIKGTKTELLSQVIICKTDS
jgi:hypothetical protein